MVRQQLIFGDIMLDERGSVVMDRPVPEPWNYYYYIGGRGYGKNTMAAKLRELHEEIQRIRDKTDELHRLAASWRMVPPARTVPEIEEFTWRCYAPTDMPAPGSPLWYARQATRFLAGQTSMAGIVRAAEAAR